MIVKDVSAKVRCDMPNCKNISFIKIEKEGFFKGAGIFLCKECMEDMYNQFALRITPKSPNNMLNKKIKTKKEEGSER